MGTTKLENQITERIRRQRPGFRERYCRIVSAYQQGTRLHERDVEIIFQ